MNMLELGPQVAIIDDVEQEVKLIEASLDELHIGYEFFNADPIEAKYPTKPITTIDLIFLDLFYSTNLTTTLDPYQPAQWIDSIIPQGKDYGLIILSRDTHKTNEVLDVLKEINKIPLVVKVQKKNTDTQEVALNVGSVIAQMREEFNRSVNENITLFYGEIIDIQKDHILLNCLLDEAHSNFQIRRFEITPFINSIDLEVGKFISVKVTTKPGSRIFEFYNETRDLSEKFVKHNPFKGLEGTAFFKSKK